MLVLSRKCGEEVVIPDCGVRITVLEVRGNRVRIGIEAPGDVAVHRAEVWEKLRGLKQPEVVKPTRPGALVSPV